MKSNRRNFLKIIGGGTIVAASASTAFLSTRTPHEALAAWDLAGQYQDVRKWALSYALLAPNPHNRQPWQVDLSVADQVTIYRDRSKNLPHTDPFDRQLTIGMGCFLELLSMAAKQKNFEVQYDLFPNGEAGEIAVARFVKGTKPDTLFSQVLNRRSCKEPYLDQAIPKEFITQLERFGDVIFDQANVDKIKALTYEAYLTEMTNPATLKENVDLMRIGKSEINANPDGIALGGPFLETLKVFGMLSREDQLNQKSSSFKQGLTMYKNMLYATPAYCTIVTDSNTLFDQIEAGRKWVRFNLKANELGLSVQPVSQMLQEYPQMSKHYDSAHKLLAKEGQTVQMLARLGYGPEVDPAPRWSLENKLLHNKIS